MTDTLKSWWLTMSEARLQNHLTNKMKYPPALVGEIMETARTIREDRRKQKIKATVTFNLWDKLLAPASKAPSRLRPNPAPHHHGLRLNCPGTSAPYRPRRLAATSGSNRLASR